MGGDFGINQSMDVIFCRNVIIYFDRPTQQRLLQRFCSVQRNGQFLFMGHSETLNGMDLPLKQMAPAVYRRL
jgi:chemotaxis protein methyltransferase CheR